MPEQDDKKREAPISYRPPKELRAEFEQRVHDMWEAPEAISYNLHPPLLRHFGVTKKLKLGAWFRTPLLMLRNLKSLRGTPLDLFGRSAHRNPLS